MEKRKKDVWKEGEEGGERGGKEDTAGKGMAHKKGGWKLRDATSTPRFQFGYQLITASPMLPSMKSSDLSS